MEELLAEMKKELKEIAVSKSHLYNFDFIKEAPHNESQRYSWTIDQEKSIENDEVLELKQRRRRLVEIEGGFNLIRPFNQFKALKV